METVDTLMEQQYRAISYSPVLVVIFFVALRTSHDAMAICHYRAGCDHRLHAAT